jgi:HlyD family secretion protein
MILKRPDRSVATPVDGDGRLAGRAPRLPSRLRSGWRGRLSKLGVLALILAAGAWAYSANFGSKRAAMDMTMRVTAGTTPFPVQIVVAERRAIAGSVVYTGSVAAFNEEDVYPRVTGRIVEMPVYPGDQVRPGQLLARLDDVELTSRVREAEAMVATSRANQAQMEADLTAAQHGVAQMEKELSMVEAELTYARAVAARSERLVGVGAISRQEYENDRSMAAANEAKREAARAKLDQARAMEASARRKQEAAATMVAQGQATLQTAAIVRDYVNIVSPGAGYVVKRLVAPGVLVQPGMAILKIAQIDRVRLQANVGEKDLASIKVGSPVVVTLAGAGQDPVTARVTSVFPFVDPGARTAVVEAAVNNSERRFLPGQYVQMQLVTGQQSDVITVPRGAVARLGGAATVWVVQEDRAQPRAVTTGLESADAVEIRQGLSGGERIVARGHEGLYDGARVAAVSPPAVSPAAGSPPTGAASPPGPAAPATAPQKGGFHGAH